MGKFSLSTILLLGLLTFGATAARAQTQSIYIAATSMGAGTGADCADALPYTFFNNAANAASTFTVGKVSPGTTVHVCGTISISPNIATVTNVAVSSGSVITITCASSCGFTPGQLVSPWGQTTATFLTGSANGEGTLLTVATNSGSTMTAPCPTTPGATCTHPVNNVPYGPAADTGFVGAIPPPVLSFQASGTSGHPITLFFESGATITSPYWGANGCGVICSNGNDFVGVDGNFNQGTIQATANGTNLADQVDGGVAIYANSSTNLTVKNLNISNLYVHVCPGPSGTISTCPDGIGGNTMGVVAGDVDNVSITGMVMHDMRWAIFMAYPAGTTTTGWVVQKNLTYNVDHGAFWGDTNTNAILSGPIYSGNECHDSQNWDQASDFFHHDCFQMATTSSGSQITGGQIYDNYFHGDPGKNITSFMFIACNGVQCTGNYIFNNVLASGSTTNSVSNGMIGHNSKGNFIFNNTAVSAFKGNSGGATYQLGLGTGGGGDTIENNISSTGFGVYFHQPATSIPAAMDYNDYFNTQVIGRTDGGCETSVMATWQACGNSDGLPTTHDTHSTLSDPMLNASSVPPYQLNSSASSAWGTGTNLTLLVCGTVPAACFDAAGTPRPATGPWDMGAFESSATGTVTLTPASYTFATTVVGHASSDSPSVFTLANSSGSTITSISISFTGANAGDFSQTTSCGSSLANGSSCLINVTFTPAAIGLRAATLSVSDSASSSPQTSSLLGVAVPSVINPSPANPVTFGVVVTDPTIPLPVKNEKLSENLSTHNFGRVLLRGFLHQERAGDAAGGSASQ